MQGVVGVVALPGAAVAGGHLGAPVVAQAAHPRGLVCRLDGGGDPVARLHVVGPVAGGQLGAHDEADDVGDVAQRRRLRLRRCGGGPQAGKVVAELLEDGLDGQEVGLVTVPVVLVGSTLRRGS